MGEGARQSLIAASGLGKRYGARWVFRRLEFRLGAGESLGVFGPNGSGKSTLLRVLAGLSPPSEGSVARGGRFGFAALGLALYPLLTAREHLDIFAATRGVESRCSELLSLVALNGAADVRTGEFSSGMRARLRLALALQPRPALLMLDEPMAALDSGGRALVRELTGAHVAGGGALVVAGNDPEEVALVRQRLVLDA